MSTGRGSSRVTRNQRNGSKPVLHVDLNSPPPAIECRQPAAASVPRQQAPPRAGNGLSGSPIDVDAIEEEVELLSSPRGFPQARIRPRRNRVVVIDEETETQLHEGIAVDNRRTTSSRGSRTKCQRIITKGNVIDCERVSSEDNPRVKRNKVTNSNPESQKLVPEEPTFSCPICMSALVEPSTTICGHIFCQECIKSAIQINKKCPTCRRKLTMNNFHRVYLPTTN